MGQPRLVTVLGAAGFIGGHLADRLERDGYRVRRADLRGAPGRFYDLRDYRQAERAVDGAEWVFHLAADMGGVGYFYSSADYAASTANAEMSLNVLMAAQACGVDRLFYASSACAYPEELQQVQGLAPLLRETEVGHGTPSALYGSEKLWTLRACVASPLDARVGILHTVYGPGQDTKAPRAKFPPSVALKAIQARMTGKLTLWGNGRQLRSYLYIDDAVDRILTIMKADHYAGPVNVGYQGAITCDLAARFCLDAAGADGAEVICDPAAGPTGVVSRDCDNDKWRLVYGHTDDVIPADGFGRLVEWLDRQGVQSNQPA